MASQDETPTHRSTAGGEPLNGTEASVPPQGSAPNGSGSHAATAPEPAGTSEHADWDAEFDNLTASQRADADAEAAADEAGDAPVDAEEPDVEEPDVEDVERTPEAPEQLEDPKDPEDPEDVEDADLGNREAAESPAASGNRDAAATAGTGGTVPGGHPKVAQRSQLPMRRASTLPDLSGYSSTDDDDDDTDDADDAGPEDRDRAGGETAAVSAEATSGAVEAGEGRPHAAPSGAHEAGRHEADGSGDSETDSITDSETTPEREPETSDAVDGEVQDGTAAETTESTKTAVTPVIAHSAETESGTESAIDRADHADDVDPALAEAQRRAQEREKAAAGKPVLARVLQVMIAVFFPVMVLAAAIRAVATPLFLWAEYHRPGFPADSYGFSTDDRMTYGSYAVDYLLNFSGSRYLGDLVGDGGEPLYLASEVSHMADVKTVLTVAFIAATVMAVLSLFAALYLRRRSPGGIRRSLFSGAVVTLVLVAALVVLAVLGWEQFFTQLHTVFFANGNWTFRLDDTLIRLFPAQFWMDAGITIAALVLLTCVVVLVCCWPTRARRERVQQAREDARRRYAESLEAL